MPTARRAARVEITELVDFGNFRASTMHALVWQWTDRVSGVSLSPLGWPRGQRAEHGVQARRAALPCPS